MKHRSIMLAVILVGMMALVATPAYAQGGATSTLSGTVTDTSGAVIPGADVTAKNNATAGTFAAVTSDQGTFSIPSLNAGTYTVTVTLMGFKTAILTSVVINAGVPAAVSIVLEVGALEETVTVTAASEILQTQSTQVASSLNANMLVNLPLISRAALNAVVGLSGVNTPGGTRESTINGLPQSTINITLDGMNIQDNWLKTTDGFFARLNPSLDAVEEVTVTTAANGADSGGQGAANIRMVTRSGANRMAGSAYYYLRHDALNANTWFNNRDLAPDPSTGKAPKTALRQYQPGGRFGGAIVIPGIFDGHDKAFFFVNYEETRSPRRVTYNRNLMHPDSERGIFRYNTASGLQTVDLLKLAADKGHLPTIDPTVAKLLSDIRASTSGGQVVQLSDPALQQLTYQNPAAGYTPAPTVRVDYNLTLKHRLTGSYNYQHINSRPDTTNNLEPRFPGFPVTGSQQSTRWTTSEALRSTFGRNLVNELRFGGTGGATLFTPEMNATMWSSGAVGNTDGFRFAMNSNAFPIANVDNGAGNSAREAYTRVVEDTLSWVKGAHATSFGFSFTQAEYWFKQQTHAPSIDFGIASGDPADSMFVSANFPGNPSSTQLTAARELYSILTGRINSITANARLNPSTGRYEFLGQSYEKGRMRSLGFFAQDAWRARANLTLNLGLRYELQTPFYPLNSSYYRGTMEDVWGVSGAGNIFKPGVFQGSAPTFEPYTKGTNAYNTDTDNLAPSIGLSWTPADRNGLLGRLLGDSGDTVLRAGYAFSYNRPGMSSFRGIFSENPGVTLTADRTTALNTLVLDGGGLPLLLRERSRLGPAPFPPEPVNPLIEVITGDVNVFHPDLQVPYSQTWSAGIQRKLTRDMAIEVRYVGTRHLQQWETVNYNETNIWENGFIDEFRRAQGNLQANIAGGRGATFAFTGIPGTAPLPIYLGYLLGRTNAGDPAAYTGNTWTSSDWLNPLARNNPNPYTPAGTSSTTGLDGSTARRNNAALAGIPRNYFRVNPDLMGGADVTGNGGHTRYNSLQIDLRKRLSHGLQLQASYVYGVSIATNRYSFRTPRRESLDSGDEGGIAHAFKANWAFELPFGQGRRFLGNPSGFVDRLVGGWSFDGVARIQSGRILDFGNVRLVGMSVDELRKSIGLHEYAVTGLNPNARLNVYNLPQDIVENTVRAFSTSPSTASGYGSLGAPTGRYLAPANGPTCIEPDPDNDFGDCGLNKIEVTGPMYLRFDLSAVKRVRIAGRLNFEFRGEMLNAFNHPNFTPIISTTNNADNYRVTGVQENSSRIVQLVWRVTW